MLALKKDKVILGATALDLLPRMFSLFPAISRFSILQFNVPPQIQDRSILSKEETRLISLAAKIRRNQGFGFSEILLGVAIRSNVNPKGILSALNYHQKHAKDRLWVDRKNVNQLDLAQSTVKQERYSPWALSSKVQTSRGDFKHIPLMDFHIDKSAFGLKVAIETSKQIFGGSFMILASDRSYHGIGLKLLSTPEFFRFLSRSILFSPIVDHAYISHQLLEEEATLRITKKTSCGTIPKVVCFVKRGA